MSSIYYHIGKHKTYSAVFLSVSTKRVQRDGSVLQSLSKQIADFVTWSLVPQRACAAEPVRPLSLTG